MLENSRYLINRAKKVAYCSSEYGCLGYDPKMGDFIVPIPESDIPDLRRGSENVGYADAVEYAIKNPAEQPKMPKAEA